MTDKDLFKKFLIDELDDLYAADSESDVDIIFRHAHRNLLSFRRACVDEINSKINLPLASERFKTCEECYFHDHNQGCTFYYDEPDEEDYLYKSKYCMNDE